MATVVPIQSRPQILAPTTKTVTDLHPSLAHFGRRHTFLLALHPPRTFNTHTTTPRFSWCVHNAMISCLFYPSVRQWNSPLLFEPTHLCRPTVNGHHTNTHHHPKPYHNPNQPTPYPQKPFSKPSCSDTYIPSHLPVLHLTQKSCRSIMEERGVNTNVLLFGDHLLLPLAHTQVCTMGQSPS